MFIYDLVSPEDGQERSYKNHSGTCLLFKCLLLLVYLPRMLQIVFSCRVCSDFSVLFPSVSLFFAAYVVFDAFEAVWWGWFLEPVILILALF